MQAEGPQLLVGVNAGLDNLHTIIVREEASGGLRLLGEYRDRKVVYKEESVDLVERVVQSIQEAIHEAQVSPADLLAIGVALPGSVDSEHRSILFLPRLNMRDIPLASLLGERFATPITLINDAASQGLGEQKIGAGKESKHMVYLYASYGIGASIFIDGHLYAGADGLTGEFGHITINPDKDAPACECGNRGCLEAMASRSAMAKRLQTLYGDKKATNQNGEVTSLTKELEKTPPSISSALIADAIDEEDTLAIQVVEEAADMFGIGIANVVNFLNPRMIIVGGDVIDEIDLYFERAITSARERALTDYMKNVSIVRAMLGTTAGAYGAAVFAKEHLERMRGQPS